MEEKENINSWSIGRIVKLIRCEAERLGFSWHSFVVVFWVSLVLTVSYYFPGKWYQNLITHLFGKEVTRYLIYVWLDHSFTFFGTFLFASKDTFCPLLVVNETSTFLGTLFVAVKLTFFCLLLLFTTFIPPKAYVLLSTLSILNPFKSYETNS